MFCGLHVMPAGCSQNARRGRATWQRGGAEAKLQAERDVAETKSLKENLDAEAKERQGLEGVSESREHVLRAEAAEQRHAEGRKAADEQRGHDDDVLQVLGGKAERTCEHADAVVAARAPGSGWSPVPDQ